MVARFSDADWPCAPVVRALVLPGSTVVDVGANMGYLAARLSDYVGEEGRVYAVEPVPETYALLEQVVRRLNLHAVKPLHACASDRPGDRIMKIPAYNKGPDNYYESHVVESGDSGEPGRSVPVRAARLDDLLGKQVTDVSFIKIDVEGHELEVVRGAVRVIEQSRPALLIEVSGSPDEGNSKSAELFSLLSEYQYAPYIWNGTDLAPRKPGMTSVDYFFLQPGHVERWRDKN